MRTKLMSLAGLAALSLPVAGQDVATTSNVLTTRERPEEQRAFEIHRELIEIDTTHSTGSTTIAAEAMAARLIAAGFPAADVQVLAELPRKRNLVARYRGRGDAVPALLLLAHLDAVEADPADWSVPPFALLERDGYYYGRGTLDDKDEAADLLRHLVVLLQLRVEAP